jgi:hypothetical protein
LRLYRFNFSQHCADPVLSFNPRHSLETIFRGFVLSCILTCGLLESAPASRRSERVNSKVCRGSIKPATNIGFWLLR